MRNRLPMGIAALLLAIIAAGPAAAFEIKLSRLEALAARQGLCDQVCIAMADGRVDAQERTVILIDAKNILYPEEYRIFKRALDRVSPPPKKRIARQPVKTARRQPVPKPRPTAKPAAEPSSGPSLGPVIPAGAILPDRMASIGPVR